MASLFFEKLESTYVLRRKSSFQQTLKSNLSNDLNGSYWPIDRFLAASTKGMNLSGVPMGSLGEVGEVW